MADTNKLLIYSSQEKNDGDFSLQEYDYKRYRKNITLNRINQIVRVQFTNKYCALKEKIEEDRRKSVVKLLNMQDSS